MPRTTRGTGQVFLTASALLLIITAGATLVFPHLWAMAGKLLPLNILLSLLGGLIISYYLHHAHTRPADEYRRRHERLAGPRPGAHLPS